MIRDLYNRADVLARFLMFHKNPEIYEQTVYDRIRQINSIFFAVINVDLTDLT